MGILRFFSERGGEDAKRFDEAMKMAKEGLMEACEIWQEMKDQFSERGSYGERMRYRDEYDRDPSYSERSRDHRGRWI